MKRIAVRTLALLLCVILCVGLLPAYALADEEPEAEAKQEEVEVPAEEPAEEEELAEEPAEEEAAEEPAEEPEAPAEEPEVEAEEPAAPAEEPEAEAEEPEAPAEPAEEEEEEAEVFTDEGVGSSKNDTGGTLGLKVVVSGTTNADSRRIYYPWNKSVTLKVKATVNSGSLKYQWYTENSDGSLKAISGATSAKYTTPALKKYGELHYICVVTDKNGDTASAYFTLWPGIALSFDATLQNTAKGIKYKNLFCYFITSGMDYTDDEHEYVEKSEVEKAAKYQIYRRIGSDKWEAVKTITASGGNYTPDDPADYVNYTDKSTAGKMGRFYYKHRCYLNGAWSYFSYADSITVNPFEDVSEYRSEFDSIAWAYNNAIVKGTSETTFSPDAPLTRAQFVMMLWKKNGSPTVTGVKNPFTDVSGDKTTKAVLWALQKGIIVSGKKFNPDGNISRVQVIMMLWKLAGSPKVSAANPFTDVTGSKTIKAMNWAYSKKIEGTSSTAFSPSENCSRAQMTYFMYQTK